MDSLFNFTKKQKKAGEKDHDGALRQQDGQQIPMDYEVIPQGVDILSKLGQLNLEVLSDHMIKINDQFAAGDSGKVSIRRYSEAYIYWTQMMEHFGPALAVAFNDSKEKAQDFLDNIDLFANQLNVIDPNSDEAKYLLQFTKIEAQYNIQVLNKDDNKSIIKKHYKKEEVQPWMKKYASTSRHLWRGQWFYEFVGQMLKAIVEQREPKISKLAKETYQKYLAHRHNAFFSSVAQAAVIAVRSREKFIKGLIDQQSSVQGKAMTDEDIYTALGSLSEQCLLLSQHLLTACEQNGFTKLP